MSKFKPGDKVRVKSGPYFRFGEDTYPVTSVVAGEFGVVRYGPDFEGDYQVRGDFTEGYNHINEECLELAYTPVEDAVNQPSHYNRGSIEVIDFIEDQGFAKNYYRGNAIKYLSRAGHKDPSKTAQDLEKAVWYIQREIASLSRDA